MDNNSNLKSTVFNSILVEGIISINLKTKEIKVVPKVLNEEGIYYDRIKYKFECAPGMPTFSSDEELKSFLREQNAKSSGSFELLINDVSRYRAVMTNGVITDVKPPVIFSNKKYPCTLDGIRDCAIDRIHAQNGFDMTVCIIEGLTCVALKYGSCAYDNC